MLYMFFGNVLLFYVSLVFSILLLFISPVDGLDERAMQYNLAGRSPTASTSERYNRVSPAARRRPRQASDTVESRRPLVDGLDERATQYSLAGRTAILRHPVYVVRTRTCVRTLIERARSLYTHAYLYICLNSYIL